MSAYTKEFLLTLYERMVLIREFEETVKFLFLEGTMPGTIHQCQGQEATAVGVCAALRADDWITSTFRGHGHALAKGLTPQELLDELFGAKTGCCKGKGGSMHVGNMSKGMVPAIAIVAGGIPLAAGMALAFKMQKKPHVVACFFGDGGVAEGAFHESVNMAAIWNLPVIFVCENNLYGASTRVDLVMKNPRISDRAASYGFRGETVDGNDVLAVFEATQRAADECRSGKGPVLLELLTYRRTGHSRRDPCHYQPKDEREAWAQRDPIERLAEKLGLDAAVREQMQKRVQQQLDEAVERAKAAPQPAMEDLETDVFAQNASDHKPTEVGTTNSPAEQFARDGFFLVPSVIPSDLLDRVRARIEVHAPKAPTKLVKIDNIHRTDPVIRELVSHPAIGHWAAAITGAKMVQVFATQLLIKPPSTEDTVNVGWHQDLEYWDSALEGDLFTAWVAISNVTADSGPMRFVRGSNHWGLLKAGDFFSGNLEALRQRIQEKQGGSSWEEVAAVLPPGGVSFHHRLTVHGSGPNLAELPRVSFAVHLRTEKSGLREGVNWKDVGYLSDFNDPDGSPICYNAFGVPPSGGIVEETTTRAPKAFGVHRTRFGETTS